MSFIINICHSSMEFVKKMYSWRAKILWCIAKYITLLKYDNKFRNVQTNFIYPCVYVNIYVYRKREIDR